MGGDEGGQEERLSAARARLILERPFLGALVLRLPLVAAGAWCQTTATDARAIYYNPDYIAALRPAEVQFMLAHDALHCALSHFSRRHHRNKHRWDVATDFAINAMLIGEGMSPPPDALYLEQFSGMTAEEIYPMLDEDEDREPIDQHLYDDYDSDSGDSDSEPGEGEECAGGSGSHPGQGGGGGGGGQCPPSTTGRTGATATCYAVAATSGRGGAECTAGRSTRWCIGSTGGSSITATVAVAGAVGAVYDAVGAR